MDIKKLSIKLEFGYNALWPASVNGPDKGKGKDTCYTASLLHLVVGILRYDMCSQGTVQVRTLVTLPLYDTSWLEYSGMTCLVKVQVRTLVTLPLCDISRL